MISAVRYGDIDDVKYVIRNGGNLNQEDCHMTPLKYAVSMKFELAVEALIDAGADVNYDGERSGDTPLGLAIKWRFPRIEQMLRDAGAR
jgi:ankyrin repeat protein